jgi:serine protease
MKPPSFSCRLAVRAATVAFAAVAAAGGLSAAAGGAYASVTGTAQGGPAPVTNPYAPAYHHAYRHGAVPTRSQYKKMQQWASSTGQALSPAGNLTYYGGGPAGIGVTTGPEKVYLVFYGSRWGAQGTDGNGNITLSGDPSGVAPYLQQLLKGLGTGGELWSGVMTQYCEGVAAGAQSCPAGNTEHVAYPSGGALAGVWADESTASPAGAGAYKLGAEAVSAAAHFGNTTPAANRDAQYVIVHRHPPGRVRPPEPRVLRLAFLQRRRGGQLDLRGHCVHQPALHPRRWALLRRPGRGLDRGGPRVRRDHHRPDPGRRLA